MNQYVTGSVIKRLREKNHMTQSELAEKISVSDKTISKWETGRGLPDISLLEPLAEALGISPMELISGEDIVNGNRSANMLRTPWYVCPICGNVIHTVGEAVISCCGVNLPPLEAEEGDEEHALTIESVEDEWYITLNHPMEKEHFISFIAAVSDSSMQMVKLYPEGNAEARFKRRGVRMLLWYCNRHGLYRMRTIRR